MEDQKEKKFEEAKVKRILEILSITPGHRSPEEINELSEFLSFTNLFKKIEEDYKIKSLCQYLELETYNMEDQVFKQGEKGQTFYIILTGGVDGYVNKKSDDHVK